MTPLEFIRKWKVHALTERAAAQEHFIDLCRMFEHPTPAEADPSGENFTFEKGVSKTGGGDGWADVWKKGFFAWEYKKRRRNLDEALVQLTRYAAALEHPPLLVVCDTIRFQITTTWTNLETKTYAFELEDLADPATFAKLRAVFHDPDALKPTRTRAKITSDAADKFQTISDRLQHRNPDREAVAHFVNQLVFCFFADSVKLLPEGLLKKLLQTAERRPHKSKDYFDKLFEQMEKGGELDLTEIAHFNGGLFDGRRALTLEYGEIGQLFAATSLDWSLIDPTIFGTLFERFLDPDKRAQIGAHYTDPEKIMMIVEPVVLRPLRREWEETRARIEALLAPSAEAAADMPRKDAGKNAGKNAAKKLAAARAEATRLRDDYVDRLTRLRILDPACGSGNFLYLALQGVKDLEYRAVNDCELFGLARPSLRVGPEILHGLEINPFAAELARMTIWIGDIQWSIANGIYARPQPILRKLDSIERRDAVLTDDGSEAEWPEADFIVGNPPFLGGKLLRKALGDDYVDGLFAAYEGVVPAEADLVCYWFAKGWRSLEEKRARRVGFVSTNSIRGGANRRMLEPMARAGAIFEAWSDEPWIVDGAAVRVSLVCYGEGDDGKRLDGAPVETINADLTGHGFDVTQAKRLAENEGVAFMGDTKGGAFDIPGELARAWLCEPLNPNGRPNSDVLRPWVNGLDVTRRPRDMWIIDFGSALSEAEASIYEAPFAHVREHVKPERDKNRRDAYRKNWWRHVEPRPAMWTAIGKLAASSPLPRAGEGGPAKPGRVRVRPERESAPALIRPSLREGHLLPQAGEGARYIATARVAKHRLFVFLSVAVEADSQLIAIARDDDATFGVLHSRFHEAWALRLGTWLGVGNDPRYTPTTTFETFPFPEGLTPNIPAAAYADDPRAIRIAAAAKRLDELRRAWLNPPDLVEIVPEVVPGYPDRILPKDTEAAVKLKERTLTNLYNQRPQWLADAHAALDRAVAAAYGWPEEISTEEALEKLLALNLSRASLSRSSAKAE
ncbi:DNA methyltransferase yeeA [Methylosinus sp. C49]|uniref:class I SAM-dependent DNA methyltransferase n=1 Tax=Methylosinus sp. C49 TaxID=2699395 RepID=UPI001366976E|nr:DNA methyltransferase [Methylosinus sp. C49]BBU62545.1 DNA methyltransferase yeeA [Methylosinus sp. C49]